MIAFKFMRCLDVGMHFTEPAFARAETQHPGICYAISIKQAGLTKVKNLYMSQSNDSAPFIHTSP